MFSVSPAFVTFPSLPILQQMQSLTWIKCLYSQEFPLTFTNMYMYLKKNVALFGIFKILYELCHTSVFFAT